MFRPQLAEPPLVDFSSPLVLAGTFLLRLDILSRQALRAGGRAGFGQPHCPAVSARGPRSRATWDPAQRVARP